MNVERPDGNDHPPRSACVGLCASWRPLRRRRPRSWPPSFVHETWHGGKRCGPDWSTGMSAAEPGGGFDVTLLAISPPSKPAYFSEVCYSSFSTIL